MSESPYIPLLKTVLATTLRQHLLATTMFTAAGWCFARSFPSSIIKMLKAQEFGAYI